MKLTRQQKAKAKRAVLLGLKWEVDYALKAGLLAETAGPDRVMPMHPEFGECMRLLRVALAAVRKAGR